MKLILPLFMLILVSCAGAPRTKSNLLLNGEYVNKDIKVTTVDDKAIEVGDLIKKKPTVFVFYRGGWCPYCNKQLASLRKITKEIDKLGYQLIAVSPDKVSKFQETVTKNELDYMVVSDSDLDLATSFGLSFKVDDATIIAYRAYGINLEEASGKKHHSLPMPAVYVVDRDGLVYFNYVNPNYKVRLNEKILLNALKELKLK